MPSALQRLNNILILVLMPDAGNLIHCNSGLLFFDPPNTRSARVGSGCIYFSNAPSMRGGGVTEAYDGMTHGFRFGILILQGGIADSAQHKCMTAGLVGLKVLQRDQIEYVVQG